MVEIVEKYKLVLKNERDNLERISNTFRNAIYYYVNRPNVLQYFFDNYKIQMNLLIQNSYCTRRHLEIVLPDKNRAKKSLIRSSNVIDRKISKTMNADMKYACSKLNNTKFVESVPTNLKELKTHMTNFCQFMEDEGDICLKTFENTYNNNQPQFYDLKNKEKIDSIYDINTERLECFYKFCKDILARLIELSKTSYELEGHEQCRQEFLDKLNNHMEMRSNKVDEIYNNALENLKDAYNLALMKMKEEC